MNFFWGKTAQIYWENLYLTTQIFIITVYDKILPKKLNLFNLYESIRFVKFLFGRRRIYFSHYRKPPVNLLFSPVTIFPKLIKKLKKVFLFYFLFNQITLFINRFTNKWYKANVVSFSMIWFRYCLRVYRTVWREGFIYIRGLGIIFFIDASFTDDEPLWEPIEWSLILTWILFIFIFAWIAENLITSRYGSYTGRDKRVWFGWYKTFWLLEAWFALSYGSACMFVITPFYSELVYPISFTFSWWSWYSRIFFYKFIGSYALVLLLAYYIQLNLRWLNWKKIMFYVVIINIFLTHLLYTHFIMAFFSYFTDSLWYQKTKFIDYIQLSYEPWKWGWGPTKRDHFSYHRTSTVFWFKNDNPYGGSFLLIHMFFFISLFLLYIYWLTLLRRTYTTKELTITFLTYCVSALKQFFILFYMFYICIFISFIGNYWRFPIEFIWIINSNVWGAHFFSVLFDYYKLLLSIF